MSNTAQSDNKSTSATKKRGFFKNLADSYKVAKRSFPNLGWWILGACSAVVLFFALYTYFAKAWISGPVFAIGFSFVVAIFMLGTFTRKASYRQITGIPGAAGAVLGQAPRGWFVQEEPIAVNPRNKDLVFRAIGRCGVVLVTEGPNNRVQKMVEDQKRQVNRVVPNVPVHIINTGTESNQVKLEHVIKKLRKFKRVLTPSEVNQVATRISTISTLKLPIPKGVDPTRMRPDRRGLRG